MPAPVRPRSTVIPPRLRFAQALDRATGSWLCRRLPAARRAGPLPAGSVSRVLVIRPGGLGDALLLLPALAALRAAWPQARFVVLAEKRNAAAFALGAPGVEVRLYDEGAGTLPALFRERWDLVVDTEQYHCFPALLARALRPRWHAGFTTLDRGHLRTHPVPHEPARYEAESFLDLAAAVSGIPAAFDPARPFVAADPADAAWAAAGLAAAGTAPVAAIMPASGGLFRHWPAERFAAVARHLAGQGHVVALLGARDAVEPAAAVAAALPAGSCIDLTGRTTLGQTAAVLARARLAVALDSGPLHLAFAVGTPTVSLFGPAQWRKWAPPGARHRVVRLGLPCSPCNVAGRVPPCPHGVACMHDLDAGRVTAAIDSLLAA